jgi:hypothetical protein
MAGEERLVFFVFLEEPSIKGSPEQHESTDFLSLFIAGILGLADISDLN